MSRSFGVSHPLVIRADQLGATNAEFPFSAPIQGSLYPSPPCQAPPGSFGMAGSPMPCMEYLRHIPAPRALENCPRERVAPSFVRPADGKLGGFSGAREPRTADLQPEGPRDARWTAVYFSLLRALL